MLEIELQYLLGVGLAWYYTVYNIIWIPKLHLSTSASSTQDL